MKKFDQFITESMSSDLKFRTQIDDINVTIWNVSEYLEKKFPDLNTDDTTVETTDTYVEWYVEPDMKKDRIKCLDIFVTKVECNVNWFGTTKSDEEKSGTIVIDSKDWQIDSEIEFDKYGGARPESVEIYFNTEKIEVN